MISYKCKPGKWVWGIIPLALPFLGAWFLNSPIMVDRISRSASDSLKSGGFENLKVTMDGRDAVIGGQVEAQEAIDRAVKSVLGTYGVRRVDASGIRIVKPVVLNLPAINKVAGANNQPELTGTWQEGVAKTLSVKIGKKTYVLGTDSELTSDGKGNWTLKPSVALPDGTYDVVVSITDGKKASAVDDSKDEVLVDTTAPTAPTVTTKLITKSGKPTINGTWGGKQAESLSIVLADRNYTLGKDKALTAKGGNWSLKPEKALADGVYDVMVKTADKFGNTSSSTATGAVTIDTTAPATGSVSVSQGSNDRPVIKGKWDNAAGNTLAVSIASQKYVLGKDKALTSDDNGNWTLIPAKPLAEGKYSVTVTSADALGNESSMTAPGVIVVDKTPPAAPEVTSAVNATTAPVFKGTWAEKAGNSLRVVIAGKVFALGRDKQLTSDGNGNWTLALTQPLQDGKHAILAESSDPFGNLIRSEKPKLVVVDTTKPDQPTINKLSTRSPTPTVTGTWPESPENRLDISLDGKTYTFGKNKELTSDGKGKWTLTPSGNLADGSYDITATVTDKAGNRAIVESPKAVNIDSTGPQAPTVSPLATKNARPTIHGTWDAADSSSLEVVFAGQTYSSMKPGDITFNGNSWSIHTASPLKDGVYDVVTTVADKAGNSSTSTASKGLTIDTTAPQAPTVTTVLTRNRTPEINGSWDSSDATTLTVAVAGQQFASTNAGEIAISGDHWSVTPKKPIADGTYDVIAIAYDKVGNRSADTGKNELTIDGTSPPTPTVRPVFGTNKRPPIGGTWPEDGQNTLSVTLAGKFYSLSKGSNLTSDGKGNWKLALSEDLQPGSYDVKVKVADKLGNQSNDASNGEIWIKPEPKPEPPKTVPKVVPKTVPKVVEPPKPAEKVAKPVAPAMNCQKEFTAVLAGQRIGFRTNKAQIDQQSQALVDKLAEIAKACPTARIEVSGHTDSRGSASFNQALSEARASAVVDALVSRGVAKSRLRAVGYGETRPIADNKTKQGLAKNRRIEFKVEQ